MVDKIGWTEPLDLERGVLEIVRVPSCRGALLVAAVDGLRQRVDIFMGARGFVGGRNHYDRCAFEGQRRWPARARSRRGERPAHGCDMRGNQGAHNGGGGGARAPGMGIGPITIMRPALQCGH
jgi:hypothetical protein